MGSAISKIIPISGDCAKYICNAMHVHSQCSDCCEIDIETTEIHVEPNDSEEEIFIDGCCYAKKS